MQALLKLEGISKEFEEGSGKIQVLKGVDLSLSAGQSVSIMGPSGSGKSTLLHILGTLDRPSSGRYEILGKEPFSFTEAELAQFRNQVMGFVFQDHHLLPQFSVLENVLLPSMAEKNGPNREARARDLLNRVGLSQRLTHRPAQLSGGERQRVAIARALIQAPKLVLCDEPTGNLDQETADDVATLLDELHKEEQNILVVVTHQRELADRCDLGLVLSHGVLNRR